MPGTLTINDLRIIEEKVNYHEYQKRSVDSTLEKDRTQENGNTDIENGGSPVDPRSKSPDDHIYIKESFVE